MPDPIPDREQEAVRLWQWRNEHGELVGGWNTGAPPTQAVEPWSVELKTFYPAEEVERLTDVLYSAEEFLSTVLQWKGSDECELEEIRDEVRTAIDELEALRG